jgi:galactitol-specific phosphotransferase system IIB component
MPSCGNEKENIRRKSILNRRDSMKDKKNLLLVCAAGFATTSMMKMGIEEGLSERSVDINQVNIQIATISNISNYIAQADLIVTTLTLEKSEFNVPIVNGIPLIAGMDRSDVIDKIIKVLSLEDR